MTIRHTFEKVNFQFAKRFVTSQVFSKLKYYWYIVAIAMGADYEFQRKKKRFKVDQFL